MLIGEGRWHVRDRSVNPHSMAIVAEVVKGLALAIKR